MEEKEKEIDTESAHSQTDVEKAENEEYRKAIEDPEDNDGEERKPKDRTSVKDTSILIAKTMIGSGVLNCPLVFKTLGIIPGVIIAVFFSLVTATSSYFLMKTKENTQHYSYSFYSKITMGLKGSIITKVALIIMTGTICSVYFKIFGDLIRSMLLIFITDNGQFYLKTNFLIIVVGIILLPLMFKKDMSALKKFAVLGLVALFILLFSIVALFIFKYQNGKIQPFDAKMLYPSSYDPTQLFTCFAGFYQAYSFLFNAFPIYLPLTPRNSKNFVKATFFGGSIASILYIFVAALGFSIYRDKLENSLLLYLKDDLIEFIKTNKLMATVLIVCHVAYFFNTAISTILIYFSTKSNLINFIAFIKKKKSGKKDDGQIGTPLVDLNKVGEEKKDEKKDVSNAFQNILTVVGYWFIIFVSCCTDRIIALDNFNGATVGNYINTIAPPIFYLLTSKGKPFGFNKGFAIVFMSFGILLVIGFFYTNLKGFF